MNLKEYLLNEETNDFTIHLISLMPDFLHERLTTKEVIEQLAEYHGMKEDEIVHDLISMLFSILGGICTQDIIGKHNDISDQNFDPEELKRGIKIEYEHTNIPFIAKCIAKDHLSEINDYYTRLDKMEEQAKKEGHCIKIK